MKQRKSFLEKLAEVFTNLSDNLSFFGLFGIRKYPPPRFYDLPESNQEDTTLEDGKIEENDNNSNKNGNCKCCKPCS